MAIPPPGKAFSVSRAMSERARTARQQQTPPHTGATLDVTGIFGALRGMMEQLAAATHHAMEETTQDTASLSFGGKDVRVVFGYTLKMGPAGMSAEPFGNVPEAGKPAAPEELQPITEVSQDGDTVVVIAELPGADPDQVVCQATGAKLRIEAGGARTYRKDVRLPVAVKPESVTQTLRNGILEVRLARADAP